MPPTIACRTGLTSIPRVSRALASVLSMFSRETGAIIVAEGVENASGIETLRKLGISHMQGYHLGQAVPLEQAARMHLH